MRFAAQNQFSWWSNGKLGEGISNPIQSCVVMEIRWNLHCQIVATHVRTFFFFFFFFLCTDLGTPTAREVEGKKELKNYVMVDCKIVTYLKSMK